VWEFFEANYAAAAEVFFATVSETLKTFLRNNWGCEQGAFFAVLHTWGSALNWHPHLHVLISAGGVSAKTGVWKQARPGYAFPLKNAMSRVFAAIFLRRLEALDGDASLDWPPGLESVEARRAWRLGLAGRCWNIYGQPTLSNTRAVVRYLARYTSRIAISNQRIQAVDAKRRQVIINYKDYRNGGRIKPMELGGAQFIRRFSRHLVPAGFHRIRQYGLLVGKAGRFRAVARAPQRSIAEGGLKGPGRACSRCQSRDWKFTRTHGRVLVNRWNPRAEDEAAPRAPVPSQVLMTSAGSFSLPPVRGAPP